MNNQQPNIETSWQQVLSEELQKPYFTELLNFVAAERQQHTIYPPENLVFNAFSLTPFSKVKVVILGQDPYHGAGQAHGLSFSVPSGVKLPPSLRNIFKEMQSDLGINAPSSGDLSSWAQQGVLLLNATLTVQQKKAGSHQKKGWESFTDSVIKLISEQKEQVVFLLWGKFAQAKTKLIDDTKHHVIMSVHPSPLSAYNGFWDSKPFSKINAKLNEWDMQPIDWDLGKDDLSLF